MADPFLDVTRVNNERSAMSNAIQAALQHNKTYRSESDGGMRDAFRSEWAKFIREESTNYGQPVSDVQHREAIQRISDRLQVKFGHLLSNGHLRYGTSQKALNLYLKFLWRMGKVATPPHCPVDRIVLNAGGIDGVWTKCDSVTQYMGWIDALRARDEAALAGRMGTSNLVAGHRKIMTEEKKDPPCSRCHKQKEVRKHHFPLGSRRMAYLCNHCYDVIRRQRNRARKFGHL